MSYPHQNPYQQDNVHGVIPSCLGSSNADTVQAGNPMSLATTEGIQV